MDADVPVGLTLLATVRVVCWYRWMTVSLLLIKMVMAVCPFQSSWSMFGCAWTVKCSFSIPLAVCGIRVRCTCLFPTHWRVLDCLLPLELSK